MIAFRWRFVNVLFFKWSQTSPLQASSQRNLNGTTITTKYSAKKPRCRSTAWSEMSHEDSRVEKIMNRYVRDNTFEDF